MASSTPDTLLYVGTVLEENINKFQYEWYTYVAKLAHLAVDLDCPKVLPIEAYDPNGNRWQEAYDSWVILKTLCYRPIYDRKAVYKEAKDLRNAWCRAIGINESRYALSEAWSINVASLARWEAVCGPRTAPSDRHDPRWPTALGDRLRLLELADSSLSGGAA